MKHFFAKSWLRAAGPDEYCPDIQAAGLNMVACQLVLNR